MYLSLCRNVVRHCARIAAFLTLLIVSALAARAQVVFSPPKNISNSSGTAQSQEIAVDGRGNINVAWVDVSQDGSTAAVFFSRSSDGGLTFSTPLTISHGSRGFNPRIAADRNGNVYIIWMDDSPGISTYTFSEFFSRSTDGGATFSAPLMVSNAGADARFGQMAVDATGNINLIWADNKAGNYALFFSRSTDGGASFSGPLNLSNKGNAFDFSGQIEVDASGNIIDVLWTDRGGTYPASFSELLFTRSVNGGATFSAPLVLDSLAGNPFEPVDVSAAGLGRDTAGNINVLWSRAVFNGDWFDDDVEFARSTDGGTSFSPPMQISSPSGGDRSAQMVTGLAGDVNVAFYTNPNYPYTYPLGTYDTFVRSADGGATFPFGWNSDPCGDATAAQLGTDSNGKIDVVYNFGANPAKCTTPPTNGLLFIQSADGSHFSAPQKISNGVSPVMEVDSSGNIYIVYLDSSISGPTGGPTNIFFSRSVALASETLSAASVAGGNSSTGTVTLNGPAPTGGAVVSLSSSNPSVVSVPATVTIPEGAISATFAVSTTAVSATTGVTISASFNGVTQSAGLTVQLVYNFSGYLPPLLSDGSSLFHSGRTVPVKFQLTMPDGSLVTNAVANIQVFQVQNTPSGTVDQDMSATASGGSSSGTQFRFDPTSNQYIYNLSMAGYTSGTYVVRTTINDGSTHDVQFSVQ